MLDGAINAWRNASLDSAKYAMEIEIGDRSNWLLPAIFPRVGKVVNDWVVKPVSAVGGLIVGADAKEPPPAPEVPETFKGTTLETALKQTYQQKCSAVDASAKKYKAYVRFDFAGARQAEALRRHEEAMNDVTLPENARKTTGRDAMSDTLLGGFIAAKTPDIKKIAGDTLRTAVS